MGLNEAAGYGALAADGPAHRAPGRALRAAAGAVPARPRLRRASGLVLSAVFVRETRGHARHEAAVASEPAQPPGGALDLRRSSCSRRFASARCPRPARRPRQQPQRRPRLGAAAALLRRGRARRRPRSASWPRIYPAVWGLGQLVTGGLSDRYGRKRLIVGGMLLQALAIALIAADERFRPLGCGGRAARRSGRRWSTRRCWPSVGDVAHPAWRASAVGHLPLLARRRLRRRRHPRRHPRRSLRDACGDLGGGRADGRLRYRRARPDVRRPTRGRAASDPDPDEERPRSRDDCGSSRVGRGGRHRPQWRW